MKATCRQCGEELLGAVNRCWRCGTDFASDADPGGSPFSPQAAAATDSDAVQANGAVDSEKPADLPPAAAETAAEPGVTASDQTAPVDAAEVVEEDEPPVVVRQRVSSDGQADRDRSARPMAGMRPKLRGRFKILLGVLAILIGVVACGFSLDEYWALPLAAIGIVIGAFGLIGHYRGPALVGILICCIALTLSGYRSLIAVYTWYTGYDPFDRRPVEEVLFDDPEEDNGWDDQDW